jgi:hypothetical protein
MTAWLRTPFERINVFCKNLIDVVRPPVQRVFWQLSYCTGFPAFAKPKPLPIVVW